MAQIKLPNVQNVVSGSAMTVNCPVRRTYGQIDLLLSGITLAELTNIEVQINGKTIQLFESGTELDEINQYWGRKASANGVLTLYFNRPELRLLAEAGVTGLGTADVDTLVVQANIAAGIVGAVDCQAWAHILPPARLQLVTKIKRFPVTFATAGKMEIDNLPKGPRIIGVHLKKSDVSAVEVEIDGVKFIDVTKTISEETQKQALPVARVPQTANYTHVDMLLKGDLSNALITSRAQDFRLRPTIDTSGQLVAIVEYLDGYAGL